MRDLETAWSEVKPWLEGLEERRKHAVRRFIWAIPLAIGAAVAGAVAVSVFGFPTMLAAFGAVALAGAIMTFGAKEMRALSAEVKGGLNTRIAEAFGLRYEPDPFSAPRFEAFRQHGLIPNSDRRNFEDHFAGEAHGAEFELYEAHLKQRRRSKNRTYYVTVFRGVLIRIAFPRTVEGVTLITRDKGVFNALESFANKTFGKAGRKLDRIGLVDPKFEKLFEVYGTDQVMARYLLTPTFMERLLELEKLLSGKNSRAVFDEALAPESGRGELLIAAETGNNFEPGTLFKPLTDRARVETLHAEIKLIDDIIATLLKPADFRDSEAGANA
ncbi:DUF3137 domain-containing protein [Maricaulaceae bacterium MS644]